MVDTARAHVPRTRWLRILPAVVLIYIVASIDKSNVSYAIDGGMDKSLGLTATFSGLVAGIFFIGYLFLQVPGAMIAAKKNAKAYIGWTVVAFGSISILSTLSQNAWEMIVARFFLGVAEGGLFPAILILISRWFPNEERGRANGFFLMNGAIAGIVGGPLAGGILSVSDWRGLFIVEGLLAFVLVAILLPFLNNSPAEAKGMTQEEKDYIAAKLAQEARAVTPQMGNSAIREMLHDANTWRLIVVYFCMQVGIYGFSMWLPTTIKDITGTGAATSATLSAIPNVLSMVGCFALAAWSDRRGNRRFWTAAGLLRFAVTLVLSNVLGDFAVLSFVLLCACGFFLHGPSGVFWAMPPMLSHPEKAAAQRGLINALGNVGGFVGPFLVGWITTIANPAVGFYSLTVFTLIGVVVTFTLPAVTAGTRRLGSRTPAAPTQKVA